MNTKGMILTALALIGALALFKLLLRRPPTDAEKSIAESNLARKQGKSAQNTIIGATAAAPFTSLSVVGNPGQTDASPWAVVSRTAARLFPTPLSL